MALPQLSILDITIDEVSGTATFDVVLDAPSAEVVTVEWATANGPGPDPALGFTRYTLIDGVKVTLPMTSIALFSLVFFDFIHDFGTLSFAPGETRKTLDIGVLHSAVPDAPEETFSVVLANGLGATIADGTGVGTILDAQFRLTPSIELAYAEAGEPYHGLGRPAALAFQVRLSNAFFQDVTVDYATQDAGAVAGADYTAISGTLTFASGETEKWLSVPVLADAEAEDDELLVLVFSNPQGGTLDPFWPAEAPGLIFDTSVPPPQPDEPHVSVILNRALSYPLVVPLASPVAGLAYLVVTTDGDEAVLATELGDFINTRGGNDAANGGAGNDVLDGGIGGNILTGSSGTDLFFIDARTRDLPVWSTITDFEPGERAVIWGVNEADFVLELADGWGMVGFAGLTFLALGGGQPVALTLAGYTRDDLSTGRLLLAYGQDAGTGSDYFFVQAV